MRDMMRSLIWGNRTCRLAWTLLQARQTERLYRKRRDYYHKQIGNPSLEQTRSAIANRLALRGIHPRKLKVGKVHTFAFIPQNAWHEQLLPDLSELGPLSLFDYRALGYDEWDFYNPRRWNQKRIKKRTEMTAAMTAAFTRIHSESPVDWAFFYGGGQEVEAKAINQLSARHKVPFVDMTFDDKQGWSGRSCGDHCTGTRDITANFDAFFTSSRVACGWHAAHGGRGVYMPEGVDCGFYCPIERKHDIAVSFVGSAYGFRRDAIEYLRQFGLEIECYGTGWRNGPAENPSDIYNRSKVVLGMGGIGYSEGLTNLKGRDFEVPAAGGGVYVTSFNPELAEHFVIGKEIACYRTRDEMLEQVRYYLENSDKAAEMSKRARIRSLQEHRWLHRYVFMLRELGFTLE